MSDAPFNGRTGLLLRLAAVLVPLSLLLASAAAVSALVTANRLETERHDRCVESRGDVQSAFVAVAEDLDADDETRDVVAATVARVLPVNEC